MSFLSKRGPEVDERLNENKKKLETLEKPAGFKVEGGLKVWDEQKSSVHLRMVPRRKKRDKNP